MIPADFNSFRCCETVGCARGSLFTISPHIHDSTFIRYSTMAIRAGCAIAFNNEAVSFCFLLNRSDFVVPILYLYIAILRYNFIGSEKDAKQDSTKDVSQDSSKDAKHDSTKDVAQDSAKDAKQDS